MINILKTDFYKSYRTTSSWVISVISVLSAFITSFSMFWLYIDPDLSSLFDPSAINFYQIASMVLSGNTFLIGIFAVMFAVSDFSYGTIKNIASKGYRREDIYASKFLTALGFAIFNLLLTFITSFITAQIMINTKISGFFNYDKEFFPSLSKYCLQLVAYLSIAILLAMLIRSLGASLAIFLAFVFLEGSAVQLIDKLIHDVFNSDFSVAPYFINGAFSNPDQTVQGVIVLAVYIVVATAVGLYTFRKRDIN